MKMMTMAMVLLAGGAAAAADVRLDARPDWVALHDRAVKFAAAHVERLDGWKPQMTCMPGCGKIWQWDSCFMALFAGLTPKGCDGLGNLDNLYSMQSADGYLSMAYVYDTRRPAFGERVNPPLFAWCEWLYARRTGDLSRLPRAYDAASRLFGWLKAHRTRACNGLYWYEDTGSAGMDNSPRSGYYAKHQDGSDVCWIDLCCQQVLSARCLAKIAPLVGRGDDVVKWTKEADDLAEKVNRLMWSERTGFYHDVYRETNNKLAVKTVAAFWALVSGVATGERADRLIAHLDDPRTFGSRYPVPSLSRDDPNFREDGGYWCGSVWPPIVYMTVQGLKACGRFDRARDIVRRHLDQMSEVMKSVEGQTIWECYSPERPLPARTADGESVCRDFVGWGGLGPIVMLVEDMLGLDVNALEKKIVWRLSEPGRQGLKGLFFNGGTVSLEADARDDGDVRVKVETDRPFVLTVVSKDGRTVLSREIVPGTAEFGPEPRAEVDGRDGVDRKFLCDLIRQRSSTADQSACNACLDFVKAYLEGKGLFCMVFTKENGRTALYAATSPGLEHDYVFLSHVDVVPAAAESQYEPRIDGDWLWGRGACDTKGNVAVICAVLEKLAGRGVSVGAIIVTDEENGDGTVHSPCVMRTAGVRPKRFILVGDSAGEEPGQLFVAEKGYAMIRMVAHGKGGHSSRPWDLDNPLPKLCAAWARVEASLSKPADPDEHWRDVLEPTMLTGGPKPNMIPDRAEMVLSFRYTKPDSLDKLLALLREKSGLEIVPPAPDHHKPVLNRPDDPEIAALLASMRAQWPDGNIREGRMSAATDATYFADAGLPIVIFAATGEGAHGADERVSLRSLDEYARMFTGHLLSRSR